jgi:hypothetical protein
VNTVIWLVSLGLNGFVTFLWVIFGAAGAGTTSLTASPQVAAFYLSAIIGIFGPFVTSVYFLLEERGALAASLLFAVLPLTVGLFFLFNAVFKLF